MPFLTILLMLAAIANPKVAITSSGSKPDSAMESRFARAPWFLINDPARNSWEAVDNSKAAQAPGGAAREAADELERRGVKVVITGKCGTNAARALSAAGIKVFHAADCTVAEALRDYKAGRLKEMK
jgi:predicted Fe-Mo cluster-binding NifX family protein